MKFVANRSVRTRGIVMIDAIVYIAVLAVVMVLAAVVFDKGMRESAGLQRNVADIERALKAGERWRSDVRAANGTIEVSQQRMIIPQKQGRVVYEMATNQVRRVEGGGGGGMFLGGGEGVEENGGRRGEGGGGGGGRG